MSFWAYIDEHIQCRSISFWKYLEAGLGNTVKCHLRQVRVTSAKVVQGSSGLVIAKSVTVGNCRFGPVLVLDKDSFRSFRTNHFIQYNIALDHSFIQYARKLFRKIVPNFQISPTSFQSLYGLLTIQSRLFNILSSPFSSSVIVGYSSTFHFLLACASSHRPGIS